MYKNHRITVIIPCLNEEQALEQILRLMPEFVDEAIVVDNGSTDRTAHIAESLGASVIREAVRGYGRSYKKGFAYATGDLIVTIDGEVIRCSRWQPRCSIFAGCATRNRACGCSAAASCR